MILDRTPETSAIFDGLSPSDGGEQAAVLYAVPIVHRTGRLVGELVVAFERPAMATPELGEILADFATLVAAALENTQRLVFARRDQERLQLLAEASEEALWDWNRDTREFWWGGGVQALLGGPAPLLNSAEWKLDRMHPLDGPRVRASFEEALTSSTASSWRDEYRFRRMDDSIIVVEDRAYFLRDSTGRAYRAVGTMRDVSTLQQMVERERDARTEAENASRAKDDFLAMLGHELRNPLAPILTAVDLIRRRGSGAMEKERTIIERQARHMVRLVDDLLDISRVTSGKIELQKEPIQLADVIGKAVEMARAIIVERGHDLQVRVAASGLLVDADPARLAQVFCNLLTNAGRYTDGSGTITVTAARRGDEVEVSVADTGVGIAPEMLARIFEPFVQERQALDRSRGGLGLGLSIVRSLVVLHGGVVEAESAGRGHGSRFTVRLPILGPEAHATRTPVSRDRTAPPRATLRILVVDDNQDAAEMMSEYLKDSGHDTCIAHDGELAVQVAPDFMPHLVLVDIGLPIIDGYEVARRLRAQPGGDRVRLVAVTGYGQEGDRRKAQEASFDGHMVKPVRMDSLAQIVRELSQEIGSASGVRRRVGG